MGVGCTVSGGTAGAAARRCRVWECAVLVVVDRRLALALKEDVFEGKMRVKKQSKCREGWGECADDSLAAHVLALEGG